MERAHKTLWFEKTLYKTRPDHVRDKIIMRFSAQRKFFRPVHRFTFLDSRLVGTISFVLWKENRENARVYAL